LDERVQAEARKILIGGEVLTRAASLCCKRKKLSTLVLYVYHEDADWWRGTHMKFFGAVKVKAAIGLKYNRV
jgi:hypothetical protein